MHAQGYGVYFNRGGKVFADVECGVCMERCPFDVEIIAKMREAAEFFEEQVA